jgi:hypothetical protein
MKQSKDGHNVHIELSAKTKFHMALNGMGLEIAREYLEWLFLDDKTGKLFPGSEERILRILERTLVYKKNEHRERQLA